MESELYHQLDSILQQYPQISQFLGGDFLKKQSKGELTSCALQSLAQGLDSESLQRLSHRFSQLAQLSSFPGFSKLQKGMRSSNWNQYYEALAQIEVSVWFAQHHLLEEIEPDLPHRTGSCDLLLSLGGQHIYCEVTSLTFPKVDSEKTAAQVQRLRKKRPGLTEPDIKQRLLTELGIQHQYQINNMLRGLRGKIRRQLPPDFPGILALQTGRAGFSTPQTKDLAKELFAATSQAPTPQVILIMLWSLERGGTIGQPVEEAPFWFPNRNSRFKDACRELLKYLKQEHRVTECG